MRTTVALVAARPDTIGEDYARLLQLAGLQVAGPEGLLVLGSGDRYVPGWDATPWQLDAVLAARGDGNGPGVVRVGDDGSVERPRGRPWRSILAAHDVDPEAAADLRPVRPAADLLHPALDAVCPRGATIPAALAAAGGLVLAAPRVERGWGVAGASRVLRILVSGGARPRRGAPGAELTAEAMGLVAQGTPGVGAVLDGTLWGVATGRTGRRCAARNVLLAGRDPVAVDAVAARLAGLDPVRVPWLRICADRGCGRIGADEIRVVGATELLDLDFGLPAASIAADAEPGAWRWNAPWDRLRDRFTARTTRPSLAGTAWEDLHRALLTER